MALSTQTAPAAAATWFRRIMWIGIAANLALAVPVLVRPAAVLGAYGLPVPSEIVWPRFAALLLVLLSVFYMPAAIDPDRHRVNAVVAVASRLAGVLFFFLLHTDYWMLGALDLVFFVPEAVLLMRMRRAHD